MLNIKIKIKRCIHFGVEVRIFVIRFPFRRKTLVGAVLPSYMVESRGGLISLGVGGPPDEVLTLHSVVPQTLFSIFR